MHKNYQKAIKRRHLEEKATRREENNKTVRIIGNLHRYSTFIRSD